MFVIDTLESAPRVLVPEMFHLFDPLPRLRAAQGLWENPGHADSLPIMTHKQGEALEPVPGLDILIIENDPAMARLTKEAFREAGLIEGVISVPNGDEALAYLRREQTYAMHPHPDVIFLDLHLPKKSGLEVLAEIKANPRLSATPVVIVSGSSDPQEVREAYELHASCYIRKPDDLPHFLGFIRICFQFWGSVVTLPPKPELAASVS